MIDTYSIERGWTAYTEDGHRAGDVIEVHPTYILVSRGLFFVSDIYVPLHAIGSAEDSKVRLAITRETLRRMNWKKPPRTPLELVRPGDEEPADEANGFNWGQSDDAPEEEAARPVWDPAAETDLDMGQPAENTSAYWDSETGSMALVEAEEEGYDTLGIINGSRLEVEGGVGLAYQNVGSGRPVVLVHDWLLGQAYWDSLVVGLAEEGYQVITLDMRGHGSSDRPWDEYWMTTLAHDLRTLIRTLDIETPTIVGHGLGAAVALQYAATYRRARPRRLILLSPAAPRLTATDDYAHGLDDELVEGWLTRLRTDRPAFTHYLMASLLPAQPLDEATVRWLQEMALRGPAYAGLQALRTLRNLDLRDELATLDLPVTVIHGTQDRLTPPTLGQSVASAVRGGEYLPIEGAGHLLLLEVRAVLEETLLGLLTRDADHDHQVWLDSLAMPDNDPSEAPQAPEDEAALLDSTADHHSDAVLPPEGHTAEQVAPASLSADHSVPTHPLEGATPAVPPAG